jgi:hypothetical protein
VSAFFAVEAFFGAFFAVLAFSSVEAFFAVEAFFGAFFAVLAFSDVEAGTWAIIAVAPRKDKPSITVISFFIVFLLLLASTISLVCN